MALAAGADPCSSIHDMPLGARPCLEQTGFHEGLLQREPGSQETSAGFSSPPPPPSLPGEPLNPSKALAGTSDL